MKQFIYKLIAPVLRRLFNNRVTSKPIKGSEARLLYNVGQHLNFFGRREINYEPEYRKLISNLIKQGDTVFDIGANIGQYSVFLAGLLGPNGKLVSIEPDSDNHSFLIFNILKNKCKNVHVLKNAVGAERSKVKFYKDTITGGRMSSLIETFTGTSFEGETEEIDVITFNDLILQYGIPDFVKIDVEGAESEVLKNLDERLQQTIFFVEVRSETKSEVFDDFTQRERSVYLIKDGLHLINHAGEIPDYANLIIK